MSRLHALAPLLAVAALAALPSASSAADVVKDCPAADGRLFGNTGASYGTVSVRNVSCRTAIRKLDRGRLSNGRPLIYGYRCSLIGTYGDGGIYRCTAGNRALRFSAGG